MVVQGGEGGAVRTGVRAWNCVCYVRWAVRPTCYLYCYHVPTDYCNLRLAVPLLSECNGLLNVEDRRMTP